MCFLGASPPLLKSLHTSLSLALRSVFQLMGGQLTQHHEAGLASITTSFGSVQGFRFTPESSSFLHPGVRQFAKA